jgi:hypothetical protein
LSYYSIKCIKVVGKEYILNSYAQHGMTGIKSEVDSSVSIALGYGLDDRAIKVRSPAEAKGFFL